MAVATALLAGGTVLKAYSAYNQTIAQNRVLLKQANLADLNATLALQEADFSRKAAAKDEITYRRTIAQFIGSQRATQAASGFAVGSGTSELLINETAILGELDALTIRFEGELQAFRKETEAAIFREQAQIFRSSQQSPQIAGLTSLAGSAPQFISRG